MIRMQCLNCRRGGVLLGSNVMSYTYIKKFNINYGNDLIGQALKFINESCADLRFDDEITELEKTEGHKGKSLKENQIPYNMEKDIDRLCLSNAVKRFLESGKKEDAFDVYYCYLEMFVGDYEKTRRMIELLSEFEANGSGLLMKHRDHYVHSVYVFLIGLAIYESNELYRNEYKKYYSLSDDKKAAHHYLEFWGLSSLFHDIGYPFELPFEQVASYFEVNGVDRKERPYIAYNDLESYVAIDDKTRENIAALFNNDKDHYFNNTNELFARLISDKLYDTYKISYKQMLLVLNNKPVNPNEFDHFMDHAYFSSLLLFKKLFEENEVPIKEETLDALTAILMHNSLYKFNVARFKDIDKKYNIPFKCDLHPLAYMLMLCDELQCYDRIAYGRNSKIELHPFACDFDFSNNSISAIYLYDKKEEPKIKEFEKEYKAWIESKPNDDKDYNDWKNKKPKLKAYSSMYTISEGEKSDFQSDIEKIVDVSLVNLSVSKKLGVVDYENKNCYLSDSNFINLYNFAVVLNGQWEGLADWEKANQDGNIEDFLFDKNKIKHFVNLFKNLSLEYKLSNINQAKSFAKYLDRIGCFYTNKQMANEMVEKFSKEDLLVVGPMEHKRWLQEHYEMGWTYGELDKNLSKEKQRKDRENKRIHPDMIPGFDYNKNELTDEIVLKNYHRLSKEEQDKDTKPMECMLCMLKMFDGLRIYKI